jgi:hypothetical protein
MLVFWILTPCGLIGRYQHLGGTNCLDLQGCTTSAYVVITEKTNINSFTTVRNSKLILLCIVYVLSVCMSACFIFKATEWISVLFVSCCSKKKSKAAPLRAMEAHGGKGGITPTLPWH